MKLAQTLQSAIKGQRLVLNLTRLPIYASSEKHATYKETTKEVEVRGAFDGYKAIVSDCKKRTRVYRLSLSECGTMGYLSNHNSRYEVNLIKKK